MPGDEGVEGADGLDSSSAEEEGTNGPSDLGSGAGDSATGWDTGGVETGKGVGDGDSVSSGTGYARLILGVTNGALDDSLVLDDTAATDKSGTVTEGAAKLEAASFSELTGGAPLTVLKVADLWWNLLCLCPCFEIGTGGCAVGSTPVENAAGVVSALV